MMLLLRAASFLCAALCSHAARAERHDGIAEAITQTAAPPSVWGQKPGVKTDDTTMALPNGLTKEDFPPLGGAKKEEVTVSTTAPAAPLAASTTEPTPEAHKVVEDVPGTPPKVVEEVPGTPPKVVDEAHNKVVEEVPGTPPKVVEEVPGTPPKAGAVSEPKVEEKLNPVVETETPASGAASTPASGAGVHAEHFQKTVDQTSQIKDAVERVHAKTQVAKEAAVTVKDSFGKYQGKITELKGQLDSVDDAAHKFEGELLDHLASDESARLQPFDEYKLQFEDAAGAEETAASDVKIGDVEEPGEPPIGASLKSVSDENTTAELSFLESGRRARQAKAAADGTTVTDSPPMALPDGLTQEDFPPLGGAKKETAKPKAEASGSGTTGETPAAAASSGSRFEKSVQQSAQIKVAVGKVQEKVELTKQAAVKVKQGFEDYKGKVVEMKNQLAEVDKQQHEYHEKLLGHFDSEEGDRMSAFDNPPTLESEGLAEGSSNTTATESAPGVLLQARERRRLSKEHVKVNAGGSFHAARR